MTAALRLPLSGKKLADPVEVYCARCLAIAHLWVSGAYPDLTECVDRLWDAAVRTGVVDQLGVDAAQEILAAAFRPFRGLALSDIP
jgi:hypothetical protein